MAKQSYTDILFGKQEKLPPVIGDRSRIEQYGTCPLQAYLCKKHNIDVDSQLVNSCGIGHELVEEAVKYCQGSEDWDMIADHFLNELPKVRPDVQPDVIKAARFVTDELNNMPIQRLIGCEIQIDCQLLPADPDAGRGPIILTSCLDMLFSGRESSLIVYDWKFGFKKRSNAEALDLFQTIFICWLLWQQPEYQSVETIHFFYKETRWGTVAYARLDRHKEWPQLPHLTTEMACQGRIMEAVKLWLSDCQDAWPEPKKCAWCDAIMECEVANRLAKKLAGKIGNIKKFVDEIVVLTARLNTMKDLATHYVKKHGEMAGTASVIQRKKPAEPKFTLAITKSEVKPKPKKPKGKADAKKRKSTKKGRKAKG